MDHFAVAAALILAIVSAASPECELGGDAMCPGAPHPRGGHSYLQLNARAEATPSENVSKHCLSRCRFLEELEQGTREDLGPPACEPYCLDEECRCMVDAATRCLYKSCILCAHCPGASATTSTSPGDPSVTGSPETAPPSKALIPGSPGCVEQSTTTELKFSAEKLCVNNLGGMGPGLGGVVNTAAEEMRFCDIGVLNGELIDLVVTAMGPYIPQKVKANSVKGSFAQVNVKAGTNVALHFSFQDKNGAPVVMNSVYITFFDLDLIDSEVLTVSGFEQYMLRNDAGQIVPGSGSTSAVDVDASGNAVRLTAMETGNAADNPRDPMKLDVDQQRRSVSFLFVDTSSFIAMFEVLSGGGGRSLLFGGVSSLVAGLCPT